MSPTRNPPDVSCIMAVNRDDGFLAEAVASVLAQKDIDFEFLIVANNCTDELWASLQRWTDPRIRLFRTSIGQLTFNLNYAIDQARAPIIARMDADDVCEPQRFLRQWLRFRDNPDLDILGSAYVSIDGAGNKIGRFDPPLSDEAIRRAMTIECQLAHPTVMFKRSTVLRHGGYNYGPYAEDYELWLRMRRDPSVVFGNLAEPLLLYRMHGTQMSASAKNSATVLALLLREYWLTGETGFLAGAGRRRLFASRLWRVLRPIARPLMKLRRALKSLA